jgi:hypothetical protein
VENAILAQIDYSREFERHSVFLIGRLSTDENEISVSVVNLSGGGAGFRFQAFLKGILLNARLALVLDEFGRLPCTMRWISGDTCGVSFDIEHARKKSIASALAARALSENLPGHN